MTQPVGHIVREFSISVGGNEYNAATTGLDSSHDVESTVIRTAAPDAVATVYGDPSEVLSWAVNVSHAADSAYTFARENIGKSASIRYVSSDGLALYTGTVTIGGPSATTQVGSVEVCTVPLAVVGRLTRADVTPEP